MKLEDDSEFHRLAMETILAMCMNDINGKRILKVEGFLSLTVESGEIFCVVIKEALDEPDDHESENSHSTELERQQKTSGKQNVKEEISETTDELLGLSQILENDVMVEKQTGVHSEIIESDNVTEMEVSSKVQSSKVRSYVCCYCEKSFKTEGGMERHMKAKHSAKVVVCPGCSENFPENDLITHLASCTMLSVSIKKAQPESNDSGEEQNTYNRSEVFEVYPRVAWDDVFDENNFNNTIGEAQVLPLRVPECTKSDCQAGLKEEIPDEFTAFYRCPDCQSSFSTNSAFRRHVAIKHGYPVCESICEICGKVLRSEKLLLRHCQRLHKVEKCSQTGQPFYRCFNCSKIYQTYGQLRRHRSIYHRVKPFTCRECNISFGTYGEQIHHRMKLHRKRICNQCQLVFCGLVSFTEHVRSCHPGVPVYKVNKQLVCEFCSSTFADEKHLNDHIQSKHFGLVHMCEVCGKVLGTSETLRIHHKLHEVETYRTCDVCGKQFGRLSGLMEHMRSKHPENVPEKYRCSFRCHQCGIAFSRRHTLHRHIENKHDCKTFTCDVCGKLFHSKRYITRHKKKHHASTFPETTNKLQEAVIPITCKGYNEEKAELSRSLAVLTNCEDEIKKDV